MTAPVDLTISYVDLGPCQVMNISDQFGIKTSWIVSLKPTEQETGKWIDLHRRMSAHATARN
jgi:hypothetical protein